MGGHNYKPQQYNPRPDNRRMNVRSNDSYLVKRAIKDAKEAQNFNPQMMRLGEAMLNSDIPTYMVIGAALIMIGAGMSGGLAGEINSVDHNADAGHGHYSPPVNDTPAPAAPAHAPVNVEPVQVYRAQAVVSNNSTNSSTHSSSDYQPAAKEVSTPAYEPKESKATLEERVAEKTPEQPVVKTTAHGRGTGDEGGAHGRGGEDYLVEKVSDDVNGNLVQDISGDHIFWHKESPSDYEIWHKNVKTDETELFAKAGNPNFAVDGTNLVYIGHDGLYVKDITTGVEKKIVNSDYIHFPAICGNKVVYTQETHDGESKIFVKVFDLGLNSNKTVAQLESAAHYSDVYADNVVYVNETGGQYQLMLKDMDTGEAIRIGGTTIQGNHPTIFGDNVVFFGSEDGNNWFMYKYDIKTKGLTKLTTSPESKYAEPFPDLEDNLCVWDNGKDVFVYNVTSGEIKQITNTDSTKDHPRINNGKIVFGQSDPVKGIYLAKKSGTTPPPTNHAPTVEDIVDSTIEYNGTWEKPIVANDSDGDPLIISVIGDAFQKLGNKVVLKESYRTLPGTYQGKVRADDGKGGVTEDSFTIIVKEKPVVSPPVNHEPTFSGIPGQFNINNNGWTIDLKRYASDPDGDALTYKTTSNILEDKGNGVFGLKVGTKPGTYNAKFIITDEHGANKETTAKFIVKDPGTTTHTDPGIPLYIPVVGGLTAAALGIAAFFGYKKKKKATRYTNGHTPPAQHPAKDRRPVRVNGRA